MKLESLQNVSRPYKRRIIVGRGPGSKKGKTCRRGQKGMGARSGYTRRLGYEGGGVPLLFGEFSPIAHAVPAVDGSGPDHAADSEGDR